MSLDIDAKEKHGLKRWKPRYVWSDPCEEEQKELQTLRKRVGELEAELYDAETFHAVDRDQINQLKSCLAAKDEVVEVARLLTKHYRFNPYFISMEVWNLRKALKAYDEGKGEG